MSAPDYYKRSIAVTIKFLEAGHDTDAGRILQKLNKTDPHAGLAAYKTLAREYGAMRVQNLFKL